MPILNPSAFHGKNKKGPFFEGWYFKLINEKGDQRWSVIPGVYIGADPEDSHSFIQAVNGVTSESWYLDYPFADFSASTEKFLTRINENVFSAAELTMQLNKPEIEIEGHLTFHGTHSWPVSILSPGIMGWFAWVPGMECYHGVVSLDHEIRGRLRINGETSDFTGGRGYIEKDWGRAMPNAWIWMQTNHFSRKGVSLTLSLADIPFGPLSFNGYIGGLLLNGELHRFATYTGAKVEDISVDDKTVHVVLGDGRKRLEVNAERASGSALQAPTFSQMDRRIMETLSSNIHTNLAIKNKNGWVTVFEDTGRYGGLEVVGDLDLEKF